MSVQGVYTGTCACACTGIHVCAWAEGWQRQAEGWKGAELPSWVHGGSWGHATPWHGGGGGGGTETQVQARLASVHPLSSTYF